MVQLVSNIFLFVPDWLLGVLFVHRDVEKLLGHWIINRYFQILMVLFIFNCATVD